MAESTKVKHLANLTFRVDLFGSGGLEGFKKFDIQIPTFHNLDGLLILQERLRARPDYNMFLFYQALFLVFYTCTSALTPAQWRSQSIYQVITDRFARTDGSTSAPCDLNKYCGGTWQGLIKKLDYIQNMGFSAVS
jgi:hypothetical protein